jgi:hypothetical protein
MIVVQCVLGDNKIAFDKSLNSEVVCDACQCAKSHQLPFPRSSRVSTTPLELVFSDVWEPEIVTMLVL